MISGRETCLNGLKNKQWCILILQRMNSTIYRFFEMHFKIVRLLCQGTKNNEHDIQNKEMQSCVIILYRHCFVC